MTTIKVKRGLEANRAAVTPSEGELLFTTDNKHLFVGDNSTSGGNGIRLSAAEILSKVVGVDGSGSSLSADSILGIEGSQLLRNDQDGTVTGDLTISDTVIAAINATPNANSVVDVFVYDTAKDSDGGAWRKRTQNTSWYNETLNTATRGATKEFPAVAIIVAEVSTITIYDATDSSVPMWMVFNFTGFKFISSTLEAISMVNGKLAQAGGVNGYFEISFIADTGEIRTQFVHHAIKGTIVDRHIIATALGSTLSDNILTNSTIHNVSMTTYHEAEIDPATKLPNPTIAVSTSASLSVILPNGKVVDILDDNFTGPTIYETAWYDNNKLMVGWATVGTGVRHAFSYHIPLTDIAASDTNFVITNFGDGTTPSSDLYFARSPAQLPKLTSTKDGLVFGPTGGLGITLAKEQPSDPSSGMINFIDTSHQSGWLHGDNKGAFLSSTDTSALIGSGELITNGTFDSNTSGWSAVNNGTISVDAGRLKIVPDGVTANAGASQTITTIVGKTYVLEIDYDSTEDNSSVFVHLATAPSYASQTFANVSGTHVHYFVATGTTTAITLFTGNVDVTDIVYWDNITITLVDEDRSANQTGMTINGTITRAAVDTGAELVGYSGFSATNYLTQPYNSELDFGTGDFYVMGWFKTEASSVAETIFDRRDIAETGNLIRVLMNSSSTMRFVVGPGTTIDTTRTYDDNAWHHFVGIRGHIYIDGVLEATGIQTGTVTNTTAIATLGTQVVIGAPATNTTLALWRIGAGAPSDIQIKEIYETERHLFQENIACTIDGASNNITALAYDEDTNVLYVGTDQTTSYFNGLVRIDSDAGAVTSLSAANGILAKGN